MFTEKIDLRLPGPTVVPPEVQRAMQMTMNHPMMDYRNETFSQLLAETAEAAKMIFRTEQDVFILAGSGAAILETAMVNLVGPSDTVIICVIGYFGEYLVSIAEHLAVKVVRVEAEWGEVIDPQAVREALEGHPHAKAVFATHCETSTGAINDIETLGKVVQDYDAVFVVDAVSSIVGTPLYMDTWGLDVVGTGSQKALMLPPGIALISVSEKAWQRIRKRRCPSFYLDLKKYREGIRKGQTPYTPNIALVSGLQASLCLIAEEGIENSYRRHARLRDMTRVGVRALGLRCLVKEDAASSPTLTAVVMDEVNADDFRRLLRQELHMALGGGLGKLSGKLLRLGHLGYVDGPDVLKMLATLELAMLRVGYQVKLGAGVAAAQACWLEGRAAITQPLTAP